MTVAVSRVPHRSRAPGRSEEGILCRPVGPGGGSEQFGEVLRLGRPLVFHHLARVTLRALSSIPAHSASLVVPSATSAV